MLILKKITHTQTNDMLDLNNFFMSTGSTFYVEFKYLINYLFQ